MRTKKQILRRETLVLFALVFFCAFYQMEADEPRTVLDKSLWQQNTVTGTVTDENGTPLPGASIVEKGTTNGTQTDFDGNFSIEVSDKNAVLMISYIGYANQEINLDGQTGLNITMAESSASLDEVVVVGYGTTKKSEITGAVGVITAKDIALQPSVNPLQNLRGKIAGVNVFTNSGAPGGNNRVLIRGQGTINASTTPLYVVDGVQTDNIDFLNPSDIESMEVLKDASSAAIYGARGANGVVLITTQGGLENKGLVVDFKTNTSVSTLARKSNDRYTPLNASEFMEVQRIAFDNAPYFRDYAPGDEPRLVLDNDLLFDANGIPLYDRFAGYFIGQGHTIDLWVLNQFALKRFYFQLCGRIGIHWCRKNKILLGIKAKVLALHV